MLDVLGDVLTVREIARRCNISPQYVHQMIKEKNIPYKTYGKVRMKLLKRSDVTRYFSKYMEADNERNKG